MDQFERRGFHGSRKILVPCIIGQNSIVPLPLPLLIDIPKNFRHVFSPTRMETNNEKSNKTRNLPESLKLLPSFLPCSRVVWWGLKLTIPGSTLPSFFHFQSESLRISPLVTLTSRYRTNAFDPRSLKTLLLLW